MLQAFESAARLGSFTLAADELSVTQGAISRQINALEELLDLQLFLRFGRHIELSEVGRLYASDIAPALARIRGASSRALSFRGQGGQLHLGVLPTFAARWLMPKLKDFYDVYPDITIHVHTRVGEYPLHDSGLDIAINVGIEPFTGLVSYPLVNEEMVIVASPSLLKQSPITTIEQVFHHRLLHIMARSEAWQELAIMHKVKTSNATFGPQFEATFHLIQAAVAGIGIALVSRCFIEQELQNGQLVELPFAGLQTDRKYCLLHTPEQGTLPSLVAFRDWLIGLIERY